MRFKLLLIAALSMAVTASAYERKCELVIQESELNDAGTYTDFPVLLTEDNLPTDANEMFDADGSYPARSDGHDLRFYSDEALTSELSREIVEFTRNNNPALGTAQIYVKCTPVGNADTSIWVYWDGTTDDYTAADGEAVWSDYLGVWHHEEDPSGTGYDSTANDWDTDQGTLDADDDITGKIGTAWSFDAEYMGVSDRAAMDVSELSLQFWFRADNNTNKIIFSRWGNAPNIGWEVLHQGAAGDELFYWSENGTSHQNNEWDETGDADDGSWHLFQVTYDATGEVALYFDTSRESPEGTSPGGALVSVEADLRWGTRDNGFSNWDGDIDETRMRDDTLTGYWCEAQYASQNSPGTFVVEGTPEDAAEGGGTPYYYRQRMMACAE